MVKIEILAKIEILVKNRNIRNMKSIFNIRGNLKFGKKVETISII